MKSTPTKSPPLLSDEATRQALDPITLEILSNALRSVADEMFAALMRSAYSTNIKERHDHSTAFCDRAGRLIVQAEQSLPIHIASMTGLMRTLLDKYELSEIEEGDIFIANDPHVAGGTHLPDINLAAPVFVEGHLLGFICNIAHHADVGGMAPGSMAGGMTEIYQEGLRIPLVRLFRRGELQTDLFELLLLNVRIPKERRGDYYAQIAACRLGVRRMGEIASTYEVPLLEAAFDEIVTRTEQRLRMALKSIPDGSYSFEDVMDDDGAGTVDIPIRLTVIARNGELTFDFRETAPQVRGNINLPVNATQAAVCYAIKALLDPDVPNNQGIIDCCEIRTTPGTLLDCTFPAPVAARANTSQRVIDVIIGALAAALPDQVVGAANGANTTAVFAGRDPRNGGHYLYFETLGGGFGGRNDRDGRDGVQVHITNTSNLPIEAIETEYPLRVESYGFVEDSGGAGKWRGGLGLRRVIRPVDHTCLFNGAGERFRHQPWGIFGGSAGRPGRFEHVDGEGNTRVLDVKPSGIDVAPDEYIVVETPGSGGYGPPPQRDPALIAEDRKSGKFSESYLRRHYESVAFLGE
ncbi:MAG TPA: hydantoinase B/oxoprolinase family protein [Kiloniellales bacterium]|nr:hydantoinase B/oxoprolinase family protein [Kiloniellales bacterium]